MPRVCAYTGRRHYHAAEILFSAAHRSHYFLIFTMPATGRRRALGPVAWRSGIARRSMAAWALFRCAYGRGHLLAVPIRR